MIDLIGYDDFLKEPAAPDLTLETFWPVFALVCNEVEHTKEIYPPSDVHLMRIDTERGGHLPRDARGPVEPRIALDPRQLENVGHGLRPIHQFLLAVRQLHLVELGLEHFVDGARLQQRRAAR